jgi:hypothetical protein
MYLYKAHTVDEISQKVQYKRFSNDSPEMEFRKVQFWGVFWA